MISKLTLTEYTSLIGKHFFTLLFYTFAQASHLAETFLQPDWIWTQYFQRFNPCLGAPGSCVNCLCTRHMGMWWCMGVCVCAWVCVCVYVSVFILLGYYTKISQIGRRINSSHLLLTVLEPEKSKIMAPEDSVSSEGPLPRCVWFFPMTSHDGRDKGVPRGLFHKGNSLIQEDSPSWRKHLLKAPPPHTITLGMRFQHMGEDANIQCLTVCMCAVWIGLRFLSAKGNGWIILSVK